MKEDPTIPDELEQEVKPEVEAYFDKRLKRKSSTGFPPPLPGFSPVVQFDHHDDGNVATQEDGRKFKWDSTTETWREL